MENGVLDKYIIFEVRGDTGSYPVAVKVDMPNGKVQVIPGGNIDVTAGRSATVTSNIKLDNPMLGRYRISLHIADRTVGSIDVDYKEK